MTLITEVFIKIEKTPPMIRLLNTENTLYLVLGDQSAINNGCAENQ